MYALAVAGSGGSGSAGGLVGGGVLPLGVLEGKGLCPLPGNRGDAAGEVRTRSLGFDLRLESEDEKDVGVARPSLGV